MDKLKQWESDFAAMERLNQTLYIFVSMKAPYAPFVVEHVPVKDVTAKLQAGFDYVRKDTVDPVKPSQPSLSFRPDVG